VCLECVLQLRVLFQDFAKSRTIIYFAAGARCARRAISIQNEASGRGIQSRLPLAIYGQFKCHVRCNSCPRHLSRAWGEMAEIAIFHSICVPERGN
jgi:hypothetical protein